MFPNIWHTIESYNQKAQFLHVINNVPLFYLGLSDFYILVQADVWSCQILLQMTCSVSNLTLSNPSFSCDLGFYHPTLMSPLFFLHCCCLQPLLLIRSFKHLTSLQCYWAVSGPSLGNAHFWHILWSTWFSCPYKNEKLSLARNKVGDKEFISYKRLEKKEKTNTKHTDTMTDYFELTPTSLKKLCRDLKL